MIKACQDKESCMVAQAIRAPILKTNPKKNCGKFIHLFMNGYKHIGIIDITPIRIAALERASSIIHPIDNKIWFIGEHTHPRYASMTHGAYQTGEWAAEEVVNQLKKE